MALPALLMDKMAYMIPVAISFELIAFILGLVGKYYLRKKLLFSYENFYIKPLDLEDSYEITLKETCAINLTSSPGKRKKLFSRKRDDEVVPLV